MATTDGKASARVRVLPSWLINQAAIAGNRLVAEGLSRAGRRRHHYALLATLDDVGPASQADLSRRIMLDRSDMVAAVNELGAQRLVERTSDPTDRRRNVVTITPAGRRQLRRLDRLVAGAQDELMAPLSTEERAQLVELLTRVVDHHTTS